MARDIPELVRLRRLMFESMGTLTDDSEWEELAASAFTREMQSGRLVAAVVDEPNGADRLVASGVVQIELRLPSPGKLKTAKTYICSMSTEPEWRRRGFGSAILQRLIEVSDSRGAHVVELRATDEGRPLYEAAGFDAGAGYPMMRRYLTDAD